MDSFGQVDGPLDDGSRDEGPILSYEGDDEASSTLASHRATRRTGFRQGRPRRAVGVPASGQRVRLRRHRNVAIALALIAIWAIFFTLVPWLLESPDSPLGAIGLDGGNVGAVWLLASIVASIALPLYIACRYGCHMDQIGLATLVSNEMAAPGLDGKPGEWPDRFADKRLLKAVKTLKVRAEKVDAADFDDPAWPDLEEALRSRLGDLDDAFSCHLLDVQNRAEELAGMDLDELAERRSPELEAKIRAQVGEEFRMADDALVLAYGAFSTLLAELARAPKTGVSRALGQLGELDEKLAAATHAVFAQGQ